MRPVRATCVAWAIVLGACAQPAELLLDLKTDLLPGREFSRVHTRVSLDLPRLGVPVTAHSVEVAVRASDDFFAGQRIAVLGGLARGTYWVRVSLTDDGGRLVAERVVRLELREERRVETIVIGSDCRGVVCPGAGDPDTALSCWGGRCVDPGCIGGDPELCGPAECATGSECPEAPACAQAHCLEGVCLNQVDDGLCSREEYCDPIDGCTLAACGDGSIAPSEGCDDANLRDGDGCSSTCRVEPGFECTGMPSSCGDVVPDPILFVDVVGASPGVTYVSNEVVPVGFERAVTATLTGDASAAILVGGVDAGRTATIEPGDRIALRMQASTMTATAVAATLAIGEVSAPWGITTFAGTCSMTRANVLFTTAGPVSVVAPPGCGHASFRMWGGGGASGRSGCPVTVLDGEGGSATTLSRASGELLAAAGGGGSGVGTTPGASGGYVEIDVPVAPGESLMLVVGAGGRTNRISGGGPGMGPFAGAIMGGGLGLGDFVVVGNPSGAEPTLATTAPYSPGAYAYGGRADTNCTDGPTVGGRGYAELRWGP